MGRNLFVGEREGMTDQDAPRCHNCAHFQPAERPRSGGYRPEIKVRGKGGVCRRDGEKVLMGSRCGEHEFKEGR